MESTIDEQKLRDKKPEKSHFSVAEINLLLAKQEAWLLLHPETEDKRVKFKLLDRRLHNVETLDTSDEVCAPFGFHYGDYVFISENEYYNDKYAWVIGVFQDNLYFDMEGENETDCYPSFKKEDFSRERIFVLLKYVRKNSLEPSENRSGQKKRYHSPDLLSLLNEPEKSFSDIIFRLDGNDLIHAHKNILSARCEYFRSMFMKKMDVTYKKQVQIITDIDAHSFRAMLEYLYTGDLDFDKHNWLHYLIAARIFHLDDLTEICYQYVELTHVITRENVIAHLMCSEAHHLSELHVKCSKFIVDHYVLLSKEEKKSMIRNLEANNFSEIIDELQPQIRAKNDQLKKKFVKRARKE